MIARLAGHYPAGLLLSNSLAVVKQGLLGRGETKKTLENKLRMGGRVDEGGSLENCFTRKRNGGSNPSPSASVCILLRLRVRFAAESADALWAVCWELRGTEVQLLDLNSL